MIPSFQALQNQRRESLSHQLEAILTYRSSDFTDFVLEIGCGHGHFLTAFAAANPQTTCIGIDIASDRIARAQKKAARSLAPNLHFIRAEASLFLQAMPARSRLSRVFLLFPDPWPKLRHHKHRVLQPPFLTALAARGSPRCQLHFRTDYRPYFDAGCENVAKSNHWEIIDDPWPFEFETVFQGRAPRFDSFTAQLRSTPA
ncbi:MAG: tRNA (guanosine(46)-N7)-methyltransferase TrmB [Opitutaceae bacterium]|nr:tRNA (guanosine(46)-N7)-methyltransferase TrmB [Opitutaceae bacterium]